jgi:hypothetical protein
LVVAIPVLVLAAAGATAVWLATRHGPLLSPDSVTYLSEARNLASGRGFTDLTGQPDTTFAPGFPFLIAVVHEFGLTVVAAARVINAVCFGVVVVLAAVLVQRHTRSWLVAVGGAALVVVAPAMLNVTDHVWSEPLFCVVLLAFFLCLEAALRASGSRQVRLIMLAGLVAGLAFLVRYAGMVLVVVGVVALATSLAPAPFRARLRGIGVFLLGATPLPALWLLRNATSGAPYVMGPRVPVALGFPTLTSMFLTSVADLFARRASSSVPWLLLLLPLTVMAIVGFFRVARRSRAGSSQEGPRIEPVLWFVIIYGAFVLAAGKVAGASVDSRIVMPIFVPLVIVGLWLAAIGWGTVARSDRRAVRGFAAATGALAVVGLALAGASFASVAWSTGEASARGYVADALEQGPLAKAVDRLPRSAFIVSDKPWTLYSSTRREPIVPEPGPLRPAASLVPASIDDITDATCRGPVFVAWYLQGEATSGPRLPSDLRLTVVATGRDGILYAVHPTAGSCSEQARGTVPHRAA